MLPFSTLNFYFEVNFSLKTMYNRILKFSTFIWIGEKKTKENYNSLLINPQYLLRTTLWLLLQALSKKSFKMVTRQNLSFNQGFGDIQFFS